MEPTKHVLVVDDEDYIREVVQVSLEIVGRLKVSTACSGKEGLAKAEIEQPDAILLDAMMPDIDGLTAFRQLQNNPLTRHIPVLFLTAKVRSSDHHTFLTLGAKGVIAKPFDPMRLANQISTALGWQA
jgi:CheY-like chemotaxis protein